MTKSVSLFPLNGEYESFLHAPIGLDQTSHGIELTVISALAQLNLDPWEEAAEMSRLSERGVIGRLATLLVAIRHSALTPQAANVAAQRLIALLPLRAFDSKHNWRALFSARCRAFINHCTAAEARLGLWVKKILG